MLEVALRLAFGLGHAALIQPDVMAGYRFKPDQDLVRFGKHIRYNQFSQRSDTITPFHPPDALRILMLGDSVLNGGNPVDQSQTISELLRAQIKAGGYNAQVLSASAGGWAITNRLGYLRKFGLFDSDLVIVQIGTEDLCQPTSTYESMCKDPGYVTEQPHLALEDAWQRYLWPQYLLPVWQKFNGIHAPGIPPPTDAQFDANMQALREIIHLVRAAGKPCWVLFTCFQTDLAPQHGMVKYQRGTLAMLAEEKVPVLNFMAQWSTLPSPTSAAYFRDGLHLTAQGDKVISTEIAARLLPKLRTGTGPAATGHESF